jgi:hypothetical protein
MSKRHQVNRRRSYGRRQHEIQERGDRRDRSHGVAGWNDAANAASSGSEMDALRFFDPARTRGFGFAD